MTKASEKTRCTGCSASGGKKSTPDYLYRKGKYIYFRFKDGTLTRMPDDEHSIEFKRLYQQYVKERNQRINDRRPRQLKHDARVSFGPATIGWFIAQFLKSKKFESYGAGTQYNYRRAFDLMRDRLGTGLLCDVDQDAVEVYTGEIDRESGASVADQQRNLISNLWKFARTFREFDRKRSKINPTLGTPTHYVTREHTKPWPEEVQDRFLETARDTLVLAFYLLRFTGQRGGDCARLKWSDIEVDDAGAWRIRIVQQKTKNVVWHRLPDPLVKRLKEAPRISEFILTNAWSRPWANSTTLSHAIRRQFDKLGMPRFKMHGLRATVAADLGSIGAGIEGIRAVGGWSSDRMARQYAAEQDQRRINDEAVQKWNAELARKAKTAPAKRRPKLRAVG
jgi:integrase